MARYPVESLSEEEAQLRHPGAYVVVASIVDEDAERRPAVFVWRSLEFSDEEGPIGLYWLTRPC